MAKKQEEVGTGITKVRGKDMPKLILSLIVLFGALFFILSQVGVFKPASSKVVLDVLPKPATISPKLGSEGSNGQPEALNKIAPCDALQVGDVPMPGRNCLISPYNPDADPIKEAEGRDNPYKDF